MLRQAGMNPQAIHRTGLALVNAQVTRQATMMAYNDVAWVMGGLFLATLPLALLLPSRRKIARRQRRMRQAAAG